MLSLRQKIRRQQSSGVVVMLALTKLNERLGDLVTAMDNKDQDAVKAAVHDVANSTNHLYRTWELYMTSAKAVVTMDDEDSKDDEDE